MATDLQDDPLGLAESPDPLGVDTDPLGLSEPAAKPANPRREALQKEKEALQAEGEALYADGKIRRLPGFIENEKTALANLASGAAQIVPSTLRTIGNTAAFLNRNVIDLGGGGAPEDLLTYKAGEAAQEQIDKLPTDKAGDPDFWLKDIPQGIGQLGSMVATGAAGKAAGLGARAAGLVASGSGFGMEFDDAMQSATERGDKPDTAFAKSLGYASVATLIENLGGAGRLFRKLAPNPADAAKLLSKWGITKELAGNFLAGYAEEAGQRISQNVIVNEAGTALDLLEGANREGLVGGLLQGTAGGIVSSGNIAKARAAAADTQKGQTLPVDVEAFNRANQLPPASKKPTIELPTGDVADVEAVALDPATGNPIPSPAQALIDKMTQRAAEIQAKGAPSPTKTVEASKVAPEVAKFEQDFNDPAVRQDNRHTIKAGMSVKSIEDLDSMLALLAKARANPDLRLTQQLPREVIEQAVNIGSASSDLNLPELPEFKGQPRPLDWKKNPEVEAWLRKNEKLLWPNKSFDEISGKVEEESFEDFKKREDARKASLKTQGAAVPPVADVIPPVVGTPPKVPAGQVLESAKSSPQGVDVTHLNKPERRKLRLQGLVLTQNKAGRLIATIPQKPVKAAVVKPPKPKRMAEISEPAKLVWYRTNPKYLATLTQRLQRHGLTEKYVLDSIGDNGRIAFTESVDPKLAEFLRLNPVPVAKVKGPPLSAAKKEFLDLMFEWGENLGFIDDLDRYAAGLDRDNSPGSTLKNIQGSKVVKTAHDRAFHAVGMRESKKTPTAFAEAIPKLKKLIEDFKNRPGEEAGIPEDVDVDAAWDTGEEPAPVEQPKKDMADKDLVDATGKDDLSLTGETGVDAEKAAAEEAQREADRKEAEGNQGKFEGMGGAVPGEFEGGDNDYVSNMFAAIDRDRIAMGKPPMESRDPRTWDEDNQRALAMMNRDQDWIPTLLADRKRNPKPLLSWENAGVVWYRAKLSAEANNAMGRINRAFEDGDTEARTAARADLERFEAAIIDLDKVVGRGGTGSEAGRSLQAQKMAAGDDFTLVEMRMQRRARQNDGAPLSDQQEAEVKALHDEIKATKDAFEKYVKEMESKEAERLVKEALDEVEREKQKPKASSYVIGIAEKWVKEWDKSAEAAKERLRKKGINVQMSLTVIDPSMLADYVLIGRAAIGRIGLDIAKFGQEMVATFGDTIKPHIQQIFDASREAIEKINMPAPVKKIITAGIPKTGTAKIKVKDMDAGQRKERLKEKVRDKFDQGKFNEITPQARALAREAAEEGLRGYEAIGNYVHEILQQVAPDITLTDTYNAISGYGKFKRPAMDEISVAVGEAAREMLQIRKIEDITSGEKPKPTGIGRRESSDAERGLIKLVNELKKKHPHLFEGSGLKSSLESRKTYYTNRMSDLREEIANGELAIKNKTTPPTDAELEAIKAEYNIVKAEHDALFKKGITDAERLRLAIAGVQRQMEELQRKIATKDFGKRKASPVAGAPALVAIKKQRDALKAEFDVLRDLDEGYQRRQEAAKLERDKATLKRTIAEQERKLREGDIAPAAKPVNRPAVPDLEGLRQQLDEVNRKLAEARKPKRSQEEIDLRQFKARRLRQISEWERRIAEGDFSKKVRKDIRMDTEANELQGEAEKAKNKYLKARWEWAQSQRSTGRKIWDAIQKTRGATVNIASSFDFSAPRQALLAILSNTTRLITSPTVGAKLLARPAVDMFKAWASDRAARGIEQRIRNRPNALSGADKAAGIEYSDLDSNKFTKYEENAHSVLDEWAELPLRTGNRAKTAATLLPKLGARGVRMSNRAFITFLNQTRAGLFDELLRVNFKDRPPTQSELEVIGNMVNISTGRGKMKPVTAQVASEVLWAPKLLASRVQFLTGQPLWTGKWKDSARGRQIVAKEYARIIAGGFLLATVARMFSDKDEEDPRSSDFGKIVRGKTRIDPWGGLQQVTTLGARLGSASTKTLKGQTRSIGSDKRYGQRNPWYVMVDFLRSKLRPDIGTAVDIINRSNMLGEKTTPTSVAKNLLVPLPMREITTVLKENGFTEGMIIEMLGQFGAGVSVYENKESQK